MGEGSSQTPNRWSSCWERARRPARRWRSGRSTLAWPGSPRTTSRYSGTPLRHPSGDSRAGPRAGTLLLRQTGKQAGRKAHHLIRDEGSVLDRLTRELGLTRGEAETYLRALKEGSLRVGDEEASRQLLARGML